MAALTNRDAFPALRVQPNSSSLGFETPPSLKSLVPPEGLDSSCDELPSGVSLCPPTLAPSPTDAVLVERARAGDHSSFSTLYRRHWRRAFGVALGMLRHAEDAEDLVQEAFLRVYRGLGSFAGDASFSTWLYRIIVNLCIDGARRQRQKQNQPIELCDRELVERALGSQVSVCGIDPEAALEAEDERRRLVIALGRLSHLHRSVIVMREVGDMSYQEIADEMGVSKGTIMSRLFHARHNLRRAYGVRTDKEPRSVVGDQSWFNVAPASSEEDAA